MSSEALHLGDFPSEILERILGNVGYKGAVNLSMTSKGFHNLLRKNSDFWKYEVQRFSKTPNIGSLADRVSWKYTFRRMARARVYTWGENHYGSLGHSITNRPVWNSEFPGHYSYHSLPESISVPTEVAALRGRFIVGMQAGAWGMIVLTSEGKVYALGLPGNSPHPASEATEIKFPEPIFQISSSRYHVVVLSEKGRVYTLFRKDVGVQYVAFTIRTIDYYPGYLRPDKFGKVEEEIGLVRKVVGGWEHSAALISGVGIAIWIPYNDRKYRSMHQAVERIVPGTNYLEKPPRGLSAETLSELQQHSDIGQVLDFAMGEHFLIFVTTRGKVYSVIGLDKIKEPIRPPFQLHKFSSPEGHSPITRVTCDFRDFAVFNKDGLVHMGTKEAIYDAVNSKNEPQPPANPDFGNHKIVDIATGENHSLALTDKGEVLAWGFQNDDYCCLGLGDCAALLRCGATQLQNGYVKLATPVVVPFGNPTKGIDDTKKGADENPQELQSDGGISYFALSITARGLHSGALVLALEEDHAFGNCEGNKSESASDYAQEDILQFGFSTDTLCPKRERGHRGIIGVTGTSIPSIGSLSRIPIGDCGAATPINCNQIPDGQAAGQQAEEGPGELGETQEK